MSKPWSKFSEQSVPKNVLEHLNDNVPFGMFISRNSNKDALEYIHARLQNAGVELKRNEAIEMETLVAFIYKQKTSGWIERQIAVPVYDPNEGLAEIHTKRDSKMASLLSAVEKRRRILLAAPPFSGKTATAQLFIKYVAANCPQKSLIFISFKSYAKITPTFAELQQFISTETKLTWAEFSTDFIQNSDNIVITDESQFIYDIDDFWRLFKAGAGPACALLSFASFAFFSKSQTQSLEERLFVIPAEFSRPVLTYANIALEKNEFDDLVNLFKKKRPGMNEISDEVIAFVADNISSRQKFKDSSDLITCYHAGLAQACLALLSDPDSGIADIQQIKAPGVLYNKLADRRCFVSFVNFRTIFIRAIENHYNNTFEQVDKEKISSYVEEFTSRFQRLLMDLITQEYIVINSDWVGEIYLDILARLALACVTYTSNGKWKVQFSCKLVRAHFACELCNKFANLYPPKCGYIAHNVERFAIDVIKRFDQGRMRYLYQRDLRLKKMHEVGFQFEFCTMARIFSKMSVCPEFRYFAHDSGKLVGRIDFIVQKDDDADKWGIEFVRRSSNLENHLCRFAPVGAYKGLVDHCVIDFFQDEMPHETEYSTLDKDQVRRILIVQFFGDFQSVKFYKFDFSGKKFLELKGERTNLTELRKQFSRKPKRLRLEV